MAAFELVVESEVLRFFDKLPKRQRESLLNVLHSLADAPLQDGDYEFRDDSGRTNDVKLFGNWQITFWCDFPVKELRVVRVSRLIARRK